MRCFRGRRRATAKAGRGGGVVDLGGGGEGARAERATTRCFATLSQALAKSLPFYQAANHVSEEEWLPPRLLTHHDLSISHRGGGHDGVPDSIRPC